MAAPALPSTDAPPSAAWHPVEFSRRLRPGGWLQVRLLGRTWSLRRTPDGVVSAPAAADVGERHGLVWLAPTPPRTPPLDVPEMNDRRYLVRALAPVRAPGPAGALLEAVAAAAGPATTTVRTPFALARRECDAAGRGTTLVVVLQPEDDDSTRAFGCVLLRAGPGRPLPSRTALSAAAAREQDLLERCAAAVRMPLLTA